MCTFQDQRSVVVCDVAIDYVREALDGAFDRQVRYSHLEGQGTLVEINDEGGAEQFRARAEAAIAAAQAQPPV